MTLNEKLKEFRDLLLTADPKASHYKPKQKENYTVWAEYGANRLTAGDTEVERAIKIQIDRFTKIEYDPIADAITAMLNANEICYEPHTDYEKDTGYIHHIWECEVE